MTNSDEVKSCCEQMRTEATRICAMHPNRADCPDCIIVKSGCEFGIAVHDGGSSWITISFCPWCGSSLEAEAAVTERGHRNIAEAERDEARRGWAHLFVAEIGVGGVLGERRFAAEKWGRKVALALYPEAYVRERLAEFESDLAEAIAEGQREFDKEFPT